MAIQFTVRAVRTGAGELQQVYTQLPPGPTKFVSVDSVGFLQKSFSSETQRTIRRSILWPIFNRFKSDTILIADCGSASAGRVLAMRRFPSSSVSARPER